MFKVGSEKITIVIHLIHTGCARENWNANPFMLLACSVNTPIHACGFHLLRVALRVLCEVGLRALSCLISVHLIFFLLSKI